MLRNKWLGHLMIIFTQVVLGVNIPITRDLLLNYLSPMGYIGVRAVGAALFFWTIQFFAKRERIDKRDFWLILLGGFLGFVFSQYLTSLSLQYTTPVYFSLILALSPVVVLLLQAIFFGEKITRKKLIAFCWEFSAGFFGCFIWLCVICCRIFNLIILSFQLVIVSIRYIFSLL